MSMISNNVVIKMIDSVAEAPNYGADTKLIKIQNLLIVSGGATNGHPTVDLQMVDADGNKYLVMATCGIFESMGTAVKARREMAEQGKANEH